MRARSLVVGSMTALLLTAACADGQREAKRLPPGVGEPADLEPAPTVSADPFVPQATGDMGQGQAAPATPPPLGGFVVVGPGEVTDGSGAAPTLPPPGQ